MLSESPFKRFLKKGKYILEGRILKKPEATITKKWFGNTYGGFFVHTEELNANSIVYSVGIGTDISFDLDIINAFQCDVYGFDPTPKSVHWVKENVKNKKFKMFDFGISDVTATKRFFLPKNKNFVSGSIEPIKTIDQNESLLLDFKSIENILAENNHKRIDLLKMDIEGAEYDVLKSILSKGIDIRQIVVEFHPHLLNKGRSKTRAILKQLHNDGYVCFGVSDSYLEYSFIKRKPQRLQ
jgi:FkbM family methyltransferase